MALCPVCETREDPVQYVCKVKPYVGRTLVGYRCSGCGLHRFPENEGAYRKTLEKNQHENSLRELRNANDERPGREFHMAQMGLKILSKGDARITFYGTGLNTDWQWVKRHYPDVTTKIVDLENMQEAADFEPISQATPSDIVVASEVVEHFSEPREHFGALLRLVPDDGIAICSTNVYDGSDISLHQYPFVPGHVAYWTPLALISVATSHGCFIDFRTPRIGYTRGGPRKKYVLFYRTTETLFRISNYFGTHMDAPSED